MPVPNLAPCWTWPADLTSCLGLGAALSLQVSQVVPGLTDSPWSLSLLCWPVMGHHGTVLLSKRTLCQPSSWLLFPAKHLWLHPDTKTFMKPFFPSMLLSVTFRSSDLFSFSKPPHGSKQQECAEHPSVLCEEMLHEGNAEMFLPSGTVGFSQQSICSRMPVTFLQWDFSARSAVLPRARAAPRAGSVSNWFLRSLSKENKPKKGLVSDCLECLSLLHPKRN